MPLMKSQTKQNIISKVTLDSQLAVSIINMATNIDKHSLQSSFQLTLWLWLTISLSLR